VREEIGEDFDILHGKLDEARRLVEEVARGAASAELSEDAEHTLWVNAFALGDEVYLALRVLEGRSHAIENLDERLAAIERQRREDLKELEEKPR
jgi:hypothetical protein